MKTTLFLVAIIFSGNAVSYASGEDLNRASRSLGVSFHGSAKRSSASALRLAVFEKAVPIHKAASPKENAMSGLIYGGAGIFTVGFAGEVIYPQSKSASLGGFWRRLSAASRWGALYGAAGAGLAAIAAFHWTEFCNASAGYQEPPRTNSKIRVAYHE